MRNGHTLGMKTAISIPDELFEEVDKLAKEKETSRSQIFSEAVQFYLKNNKSKKLLEELNSAYALEESTEEKIVQKKSTEYYKSQILKKEE